MSTLSFPTPTMSNQFITASFNDAITVSFRSDAWFNATQVAAKFGKKPDDWLRTADTKDYISAISQICDFEENQLFSVKRGAPTNGGGTWMHPKLGIPFARWLDARFGVWCDLQIEKILHPQYALKALSSKKALPGGLTLEQQDAIKALVRSRVEALPKERQGGAAITCWSALKTKFGCTYKAIAPELFAEALSLVARLDLLGQPALPAPEPIEPPRYNFPLANWQPATRIGATAWFTFQEWVRLREQGSSQLAELIYTLGRDGHDVSGPQTEFRGLCHMVESMHMQWESMRYMFDKMEGRGLRIQLQPAST